MHTCGFNDEVSALAPQGHGPIGGSRFALENLNGDEGDDIVYGEEGNDTIYGHTGSDLLYGGNGDDLIYGGGGGTDTLYGDAGDDVLYGASDSNDTIYGGDGVDQINSYTGEDVIDAGDGNDRIYTSADATVDGGAGSDKLYFSEESYAVTVDLAAGTLANTNGDTGTVTGIEHVYGSAYGDTITGSTGNDTITAASGDDTLYGGDGKDDLYGGNDEDVLYGGTNDDYLYGDPGDDVLHGEAGMDRLYGGSGADIFAFESATAYTDVDEIRDWDAGEGDAIDISDLLFGYDPLSDAITDFVQITDAGSHSALAVDADGGADNFVQVATILNTTGMTDEAALVTSGNLLAA